MSGPYRVLLVTDAYAPMIGGADRAVSSVATELTSRGHTVAVATAWQPGLPAHETRDGIPVHRLRDLTSRLPWISADPYRHVPPPFPDPEGTVRFRRLIKRFRPDVVHSYGWLTYSCAAALAGTGVPLVLSLHDYGNFCALRTLLHMDREACSGAAPAKCLRCSADHYGRVKGAVAAAGVLGGRRLLTRHARGVQSNSGYTRSVAWRDLLAGRAKFTQGSAVDVVIPPFHDRLPEAAPDRALLDRLPESYILFVGALRRVKGLEQLLEAHGRLEDAPPLVMVGTHEIDTPASFPPGVTVLEAMPHATVMAAWDRALFGVFPSLGPEPFGIVVNEAMSRGRAVIGTSPGGHGEMIVDGKTGLIVPGGDVDALVAAMRRLIDDRELRERLGAAAATRASLFEPEVWVPRVEELYDAAAGSVEAGGGPVGAPA
jgi:glycosyltransferase involved in cell wall biosynthesis